MKSLLRTLIKWYVRIAAARTALAVVPPAIKDIRTVFRESDQPVAEGLEMFIVAGIVSLALFVINLIEPLLNLWYKFAGTGEEKQPIEPLEA